MLSIISYKTPGIPGQPSAWKKRKNHASWLTLPWTLQRVDADDNNNDEKNGYPQQQQRQQHPSLKKKRDSMPGTWYYQSNHIMINNDRLKRDVPALTRLSMLDEVARVHARAMADLKMTYYTDVMVLVKAIKLPFERVGENVIRGKEVPVRDMHKLLMERESKRRNILDRKFTCFGVGTARGSDGCLYLCQIFAG